MERKIICIVGPTASGKTSLAVWLAKKLKAEIISADSRQVYKKLDIGTSKDLKGYGKVKYHLIDVCKAEEKFTLFDWLDQAQKGIEILFEKNIVPIVVGGTGLYVQALVEGFESHQPSAVSVQHKKYNREELDKKTLTQLQKIYSQFETRKSQIDLNNPRRLIRAIELSQEGTNPTKKKPDFEVLQIGIIRDREELYNRIDGLVDQWFEEGFLEEVRGLIDSGVSIQWLHDIGLEYRIVSEYILNGEQPNEFDEMKQSIKFAIHHYARRQLTWFRRFTEIKWVNNREESLEIAKNFLKL